MNFIITKSFGLFSMTLLWCTFVYKRFIQLFPAQSYVRSTHGSRTFAEYTYYVINRKGHFSIQTSCRVVWCEQRCMKIPFCGFMLFTLRALLTEFTVLGINNAYIALTILSFSHVITLYLPSVGFVKSQNSLKFMWMYDSWILTVTIIRWCDTVKVRRSFEVIVYNHQRCNR